VNQGKKNKKYVLKRQNRAAAAKSPRADQPPPVAGSDLQPQHIAISDKELPKDSQYSPGPIAILICYDTDDHGRIGQRGRGAAHRAAVRRGAAQDHGHRAIPPRAAAAAALLSICSKLLGKEDIESGESPVCSGLLAYLSLAAILTVACLVPMGFTAP
jgi:hypothetical protein